VAKLLLPEDMPKIPGVNIPNDFYWVLPDPPLAGMRYPDWSPPWQTLNEKGFKYVVNLHEQNPRYDPTPLALLHAVELQDLWTGKAPTSPDREKQLINEAVGKILRKLCAKDGVVVHCYGGRGRTGTVLGRVLHSLGFPSHEIVTYLDELHKRRGKSGWPESPWQKDVVTHFRPAG